MAMGTWIGGFLGLMSGGPLGALAGIVLGALFDYGLDNVNSKENSGTFSTSDANASRQAYGERNSFLFAMLVLASYVIKADGKVMHSEMELVRQFLRQNFGEAAKEQGEAILKKLFDEQKRQGTQTYRNTVAGCCQQIAANLDYSQRLQLLNLLVLIAQADGIVADSEVVAIRECASWMGMSAADVDSMLNLKQDNLESAYKVLGVSPNATDDEVRKAYRKLALAHHPDRVAALGEDVRKAAEQKFQEINAAKEKIYKARGM